MIQSDGPGTQLLDPASVSVLVLFGLFAFFIWWGSRKSTIQRYARRDGSSTAPAEEVPAE
jgi:hypothetical protein